MQLFQLNVIINLRFSPEIKRSQAVYLPFGVGPRNCVGNEFSCYIYSTILIIQLLNFNL
jgi:cytochrome P450